MPGMPDAYEQLLDAAIRHVEELRAQGVRFVAVSPDTLEALRRPVPVRPAQPSGPPAAKPQQLTVAPPRPPVAVSASAGSPLDLSLGLPAETPAAQSPSLSPEARAAAFADLRGRVLACTKCPHLAAARRNVVFGVGSPSAE